MWRPVATSSAAQTVFANGSNGSPERLRANLFGTGVGLYFTQGMRLSTSATVAPFLTWNEGSVGPNVPTPATSWFVLSFRDSQPALMFVFEREPGSVRVEGKAGNWTLATAKPYVGWIRIFSLTGNQAAPASRAAELGQLAQRAKRLAPMVAGPPPQLVGIDLTEDAQGVIATWRFDKPFAVAPPPVTLAPLGDYPLRTNTGLIRSDVVLHDGPLSFNEGPEMSVRLPVRRIPAGRALTLGKPDGEPPATVSFLDAAGVSELGLLCLMGHRDPLTLSTAQSTLEDYLEQAIYVAEPHTKQQMPYDDVGTGIDIAAAHSVLMQALLSAQRPDSAPNSLLTSLSWRRDAWSWLISVEESLLSRRASALAALAGAMCAEPERRFEAALLQAGLASEAGLRVWRARRSLPSPDPSTGDPFAAVRGRLFGMVQRNVAPSPWVDASMSPVRVYGPEGIVAETTPDGTFLVGSSAEGKPFQVSLAASTETKFSAGLNVADLRQSQAFGSSLLWITPEKPGPWRVKLVRPEWAPALPKAAPQPHFAG